MSEPEQKTLREKIMLDHAPLHRQPIAWAVVIVPLFFAFYLFDYSDYGTLNLFSSSAQLNFLSKAKLPLLIMGLGTVFLSIVVNTHRTIQTNKQIEVTQKKNDGDLFLSHYKMCSENVSHITTEIECKITELNDHPQGSADIYKRQRLKISVEHKKLNVLYNIFFPNNNLEDGIVANVPTDICEELQWIIKRNMTKVIKTNLKEVFDLEVDRLTKEAEENPRSVGDFDCSEFVCLEPETIKNSFAEAYTPERVFNALFVTMLHEIGILFDQYFAFVKIQEDDEEVSNDLVDYFWDWDDKYFLSRSTKVMIVIKILHHFVDLQVAMGKTKNESKTRAYIAIYNKYLSQVEILSHMI